MVWHVVGRQVAAWADVAHGVAVSAALEGGVDADLGHDGGLDRRVGDRLRLAPLAGPTRGQRLRPRVGGPLPAEPGASQCPGQLPDLGAAERTAPAKWHRRILELSEYLPLSTSGSDAKPGCVDIQIRALVDGRSSGSQPPLGPDPLTVGYFSVASIQAADKRSAADEHT
jgi:hypothetical protein